jgi:hypothetical protein
MLSFEALNRRQAARTGRTDRIIIIVTTTTRMGGGHQGRKSRGARATTTLELSTAEAIAQ